MQFILFNQQAAYVVQAGLGGSENHIFFYNVLMWPQIINEEMHL